MATVVHEARALNPGEIKLLDCGLDRAWAAFLISQAMPNAMDSALHLLCEREEYHEFANTALENLVLHGYGRAQADGRTDLHVPAAHTWLPGARTGLQRVSRSIRAASGIDRQRVVSLTRTRDQEILYDRMVSVWGRVDGGSIDASIDPREHARQIAVGQIVIPGFLDAARRAEAAEGNLFSIAHHIGLKLFEPDPPR